MHICSSGWGLSLHLEVGNLESAWKAVGTEAPY